MKTKISEIQITPIKAKDGLVAIASFVYNEDFYMGSIGIYTRPQAGYRLAYPTRKTGNGSFNLFHPINKTIAEEIEKAVISKFEEVMNLYDRHDSFNLE